MAILVLKLGGSVCLDPSQVQAVAGEVRSLQSAGHHVVIVHGGGPQLDSALAALGETVQKVDGLRVTSKPAAVVVLQLMDSIGKDLSAQLVSAGLEAHHVPAAGEGFQATPKRSEKGDLGRVGTVQRFTAMQSLAGARDVAVVTPVGFDGQGPLNINADEGAASVATALRATWLILATDVAAVRGAEGEALARLTPRDARKLIQENTAQGGMVPKLTAAVAALSGGVSKVVITKVQPGILAEAVLHGKPHGTLVENDLAVA